MPRCPALTRTCSSERAGWSMQTSKPRPSSASAEMPPTSSPVSDSACLWLAISRVFSPRDLASSRRSSSRSPATITSRGRPRGRSTTRVLYTVLAGTPRTAATPSAEWMSGEKVKGGVGDPPLVQGAHGVGLLGLLAHAASIAYCETAVQDRQ